MIGQNVLLELVEGDKVQLYVHTSTAISDHKNSHYTQFIGCLLRPAVDTLAAVMRRLGSNEVLDEDVSTAEDFSRKGGNGSVNGDVSRSRRGGSKSRILSPPPQGQPPNGNTNGVIHEEEEVAPRVKSPAPTSAPAPAQTAAPAPQQNGNNEDESSKDKPSQSYLALTKLGMGKKEENNNKKESPKESKKSIQKAESKDAGKRKTMAEMASNTLKGFAKM